MATVTVSNSTALLSALNAAHAGDTILLAPGSYSHITIANYNKGGTVNIASASAANEAVLNGFTITNSTGLNFSNLVMSTANYTSGSPYSVYGSSNMTFNNLNFHGAVGGVAANQATGLYINGTTNVTVSNSTFNNLYTGLGEDNNTNVKILNKSFTNLGDDGVDNSGSNGVLISGNSFTDFQTAAGIHADSIQFWTNGQTHSASNITITNNTMIQGTGSEFQGIFMTDNVGDLPYQNVTITGNTIHGGQFNGIVVDHANNVVASGNTLFAVIDPTAVNPAQPRLIIDGVTNATVTNNIAAQYEILGDTGLTTSNNGVSGYLTATNTQLLVTSTPLTGGVERGSISGAVHITDTPGSNPILSGINGHAVAAGGSTIATYYGQVLVQQNGTFVYTATREGLTAGASYVDNFTAQVTDGNGHTTSLVITVDFTGSSTGNGGVDAIVGGAGAETISGFGAGSTLTSGTGPDTFAFTSLTQSTPTHFDTIKGFGVGDIIDLSAVDPHFQVVSAFNHHANELMIVNDGGGTWDIYGDTTGSGSANFKIHLTGVTTPITAASFHI